MKQLFTSVFMAAALFLGTSAYGANHVNKVTYAPSQQGIANLNLKVSDFTLKDVTVNGQVYQVIVAENTIPNLEKGMPAVPSMSVSVAIPNLGATELVITSVDYTDYPNVDILPSKGNLTRNVKPGTVAYERGLQYNVDQFYPENVAALETPYILRDVRGQVVRFSPFQYNPVTKVLRVYNEININVQEGQGAGINEIYTERPAAMSDVFLDIYENNFVNFKNEYRYTPIGEAGGLLIIAKDAYVSAMTDFVNWKIARGTPTTIVSINTVGNSEAAIKSYISTYYNTNQNSFVLLVGDHADVACGSYGTSGMGETLWSDSKYAMISGNDRRPEVLIGRFSCSNTTHLNTQITRVMEYEKIPLAGDWYKKAIGVGSDEGAGAGDDGEADWQHLRNIRTDLLNFGFTEVHEFYDGSHGTADAAGDPNSTMVSNAVNSGATLFNYTGHGDQNTCVTSNYSSTSINNGSNYGKYPFVISVACNNGTFPTGTCLAESFLQANNSTSGPKGAIACAASSILMAWAPPMATQDEIVDILVESYANNKKYTLGALFYNGQNKMLDDYGSQGNEVMDTWIFFGDPSSMIRTADPATLTASHAAAVVVGTSTLNVTCNVEGALICVSQNNQILGTGTVSGGSATINFTALSSTNPLTVVGTKYNYKPYEGNVTVSTSVGMLEQDVAEFKLSPNPAKDEVRVSFYATSSNVNIAIINGMGQVVKNLPAQGLSIGVQLISLDVSELASGVYFVSLESDKNRKLQKLIIK